MKMMKIIKFVHFDHFCQSDKVSIMRQGTPPHSPPATAAAHATCALAAWDIYGECAEHRTHMAATRTKHGPWRNLVVLLSDEISSNPLRHPSGIRSKYNGIP